MMAASFAKANLEHWAEMKKTVSFGSKKPFEGLKRFQLVLMTGFASALLVLLFLLLFLSLIFVAHTLLTHSVSPFSASQTKSLSSGQRLALASLASQLHRCGSATSQTLRIHSEYLDTRVFSL